MERGEDERLESQADGNWIDDGPVAADRARALQLPQTAMAGGDAEIDPRSQLGHREPAVLLQLGKNLSVNAIDEQDSTPASWQSWKIRNHLPIVPA